MRIRYVCECCDCTVGETTVSDGDLDGYGLESFMEEGDSGLGSDHLVVLETLCEECRGSIRLDGDPWYVGESNPH